MRNAVTVWILAKFARDTNSLASEAWGTLEVETRVEIEQNRSRNLTEAQKEVEQEAKESNTRNKQETITRNNKETITRNNNKKQ